VKLGKLVEHVVGLAVDEVGLPVRWRIEVRDEEVGALGAEGKVWLRLSDEVDGQRIGVSADFTTHEAGLHGLSVWEHAARSKVRAAVRAALHAREHQQSKRR